MNMKITDLIGSILYFEKDGIGIDAIEIISNICVDDSIKIHLKKSISSLYCELYDPNGCFNLIDDKIVPCKEKQYCDDLLKELYFNRLTSEEKNQVYCIVNRL